MPMPSRPIHPSDQADGLRRLFASQRPTQRLVPLVANPHVSVSAILLERLSSALVERGSSLLVIDAADTSPRPHEMIEVDLAGCIEVLGPQVRYLAARGQPVRHVNARGSAEAWLARVAGLVPQADVLLLHANARDLARLMGRRAARPVLMGAVQANSLTDAYTSMKLLSQRTGLMSFDLLMAADGRPRRAETLAERLAQTGDHFLGTVIRTLAMVDSRQALQASLPASLLRLADDQIQHEDPSADVVAAGLGFEPPVLHDALPGALASLLY